MLLTTKDLLVAVMEVQAKRRIGRLACQLIRAKSADREMVLAELEYQRWLEESCQTCRSGS